jgi:Fuc2NAc and GlcNAc transferase
MYIVPISFLLGVLGAFIISKYALAFGLVDLPNERSSHRIPTPRGGGIGICAAVIFAAVFFHIPLVVTLSVAVLAIASFLDDRWGLRVAIRFIIQFGCAASIIVLLYHHASPLYLLPLFGLFWIIFITGTANFYNFMDGINGISGLTGVTAFGFLSILALILKLPLDEVFFNLSVVAACLGFLPFNLFKARVFMGDIGSVVIGFLFAVQVYRYANDFTLFLLLACFLFLYYLDAITTIFIRWRDGEKLTQAHRRHLYQLLTNEMKNPHWKISLGYAIAQTVISAAVLSVYVYKPVFFGYSIFLWAALFVLATFVIRKKIGILL